MKRQPRVGVKGGFDDQYICRRLRRLIRVMYSISGSGFYARPIEDNRYAFGCTTPPIHNEVSKSVATYLVCGNLMDTINKIEA